MNAVLKSMQDDDMNDAAEIAAYEKRPELHRLVQALATCAELILPKFQKVDMDAQVSKATYFKYARAVAWLGGLAVFFAILQLSYLGRARLAAWSLDIGTWKLEGDWLLPGTEFLLAAAAVAIALIGLGGQKQQKWFLERYQAERLRLLKFRFLTDPDLWSGDAQVIEKRRKDLEADVEEITVSRYPDLQTWVSAGSVPEVVDAPPLTEVEWREVKSYYGQKRLLKQTGHFVDRMKRAEEEDNKTRILPSVLFFGSVAFVLMHFAVDLVGEPEGRMARTALLLAAALPGFGAVIRARRGVLEFARNASRCESTHHVLLKLGARLRDADDQPAVFREIGFCEHVLESDLREWLRLMVESEWFG